MIPKFTTVEMLNDILFWYIMEPFDTLCFGSTFFFYNRGSPENKPLLIKKYIPDVHVILNTPCFLAKNSSFDCPRKLEWKTRSNLVVVIKDICNNCYC